MGCGLKLIHGAHNCTCSTLRGTAGGQRSRVCRRCAYLLDSITAGASKYDGAEWGLPDPKELRALAADLQRTLRGRP